MSFKFIFTLRVIIIIEKKQKQKTKTRVSYINGRMNGWTRQAMNLLTYAEYKQRELNKKGKKNGKALGKHVINLYSFEIS